MKNLNQKKQEIKAEFKLFWEKEWDKLEGDINKYVFKFWKEAWERAENLAISEFDDFVKKLKVYFQELWQNGDISLEICKKMKLDTDKLAGEKLK